MAKILIVDDEQDFRDLVGKVLLAAGHEVLAAATGEEGLATLRSQGAELLVLDVNMPGLTGFEVCSEIRKDPKFYKLPVILLTVNRRPQDQKDGFDSGADDYLSKPFKPEELRARVFALLRRTK